LQIATSVSGKTAVFVFRVEKVKIYPEDGGGRLFQNIGTYLQD
jgi:hypothetical protein